MFVPTCVHACKYVNVHVHYGTKFYVLVLKRPEKKTGWYPRLLQDYSCSHKLHTCSTNYRDKVCIHLHVELGNSKINWARALVRWMPQHSNQMTFGPYHLTPINAYQLPHQYSDEDKKSISPTTTYTTHTTLSIWVPHLCFFQEGIKLL